MARGRRSVRSLLWMAFLVLVLAGIVVGLLQRWGR
jgi:hypothetical protein